MEERQRPSPFWHWPGMWFRDEAFWRDVASRTLAALVSATVIFVVAVAAGYLGRPDLRPVAYYAAAGVLLWLVGFALASGSRPRRAWTATRAVLGIALAFVLILVVLPWAFQRPAGCENAATPADCHPTP
jgi:hypothetical protein